MPNESPGTDGGSIDWPAGWDRTPADRRDHTGKFDTDLRDTLDDVERELVDRIGVDDWRLSTAAEHQQQNPNYPYADALPDDPGAVVRWRMDDDQYAIACDRYTTLRDNLRALYLYLREKRKMEARPVTTGQSEFATARLPSGAGDTGDDDIRDDGTGDGGVVATGGRSGMTDEEAAALLGLASPEVSDHVVKISFEEAVKVEHPDQGGRGNIDRLKRARDHLLG